MAPAAARPPRKKKTFVQKRGQVFKRVLRSLFSWLPRCRLQLFRKNLTVPLAAAAATASPPAEAVEPEPTSRTTLLRHPQPRTPSSTLARPGEFHPLATERILRVLVKQVHGHDDDDDTTTGAVNVSQLNYGSEPES